MALKVKRGLTKKEEETVNNLKTYVKNTEARKERHQKDYESYAKTSDYWKQSSPKLNPFGYPKGYTEQSDAFRTMQKERFMYGEYKHPNVFKKIALDIKKLHKDIKRKKKKEL
jgi:hypothetical protein